MTWCFKERGPGYHWIVDLYSRLGLPICPRYTAQRNLLLTSTARILGETWSSSSDARKINFFLFGVKSVNYDINCTLFREVQTFKLTLIAFRWPQFDCLRATCCKDHLYLCKKEKIDFLKICLEEGFY